MPKKLTYIVVNNGFLSERYKLLSKKYINNKQHLRFICPAGHEYFITWHNWAIGQRCGICAGNKKHDIKFISTEFKKHGFVLLTNYYKNCYQKLHYMCPNGHKHFITWNDWQSGARCPYCSNKAKKDIEFIKLEFEKEGYKLLNDVYINAYTELMYICPSGHKHSITWNNWSSSGSRCPQCARLGDRNPNWKGGISCEPYCDVWLDKEFKESIKERDNYECQNPDCWGTSERLTIHHIDYNKKNCRPNNLITLCNSCNVRANKNRKYWQEFYNNVLCKYLVQTVGV